MILIVASGEMTWLQTLAIGQEEGFIELGECQIPVKSDVSDSLNGDQSHVLNNVLANLKHKLQHDRPPKRPECVPQSLSLPQFFKLPFLQLKMPHGTPSS